jgi:hypothetical protein
MRLDSSRVRVSGPLAAHADDFGEALRRRGYPPERATRHVQLLAQLSRWLEERELDVSDLSEERVAEFLAARRAKGYAENPSLRWVLRLLGFLPALEVAKTAPTAPTLVEAMIEHYRRYLVEERGLAASTVRTYLDVASLFLSRWEGPDGELNLPQVGAAEVTTFVLDECRPTERRLCPGAGDGPALAAALLVPREPHRSAACTGGAGRLCPKELLAPRTGRRGAGGAARQLRHLHPTGKP